MFFSRVIKYKSSSNIRSRSNESSRNKNIGLPFLNDDNDNPIQPRQPNILNPIQPNRVNPIQPNIVNPIQPRAREFPRPNIIQPRQPGISNDDRNVFHPDPDDTYLKRLWEYLKKVKRNRNSNQMPIDDNVFYNHQYILTTFIVFR